MNRIWLIVFGDFVSFLAAFIILILVRFSSGNYMHAIAMHAVPFLLLYLIWVLIFYIFGLYDLVTIKPTIPYLKRWVWAIITSFIVGLLLFYFAPIFGISPKVNLLIQVGFFGIFSFLLRRIIYTLFSKAITRPAVLVGSSEYLDELEITIEKTPQIGLQIEEHLDSIDGLRVEKYENTNTIIILDKKAETSDDKILELHKKGIEVIDTAAAYEKYLFKIPVNYIDASFVSNNINTNRDILYTFITFVADKLFAILILVLSSPILLVTAILIWREDKGPILYTQNRVGLNGKIFLLYKLRSMTTDAEKNGAQWSTGKADPRVTRVGRVIRKLHIDEIPQMINILKGDLALVGPRPERPEFVYPLEETIPHYKLRHIIRPGFTGWAQIKYHYANTNDESKEKFEYDLYYIKNRNIFIDLGIFIRTVQIVFTH